MHRVRELQDIAAEQTKESADKIVKELNQIKRDAHADKAYGAAVSAVATKAKVLGIIDKPQTNELDFKTAKSMHDVGRKLLMSVGFQSPDDCSIAEAIKR